MSKQPLSPGKTRAIVALCAVVVAVAAWVLWPLALGPDPTPARGLPESDFVGGDGAAGDRDGDGVPDPEDIVASARAYTATRPRYGSAYYEGGPPTDGRGVCTDLLAAALKGAGWDLQSLVDEDIRAAPGAYGVVEPDRAIDYRRVRNVAVYLGRHAASLTLDPRDAAAWRAGDIAVFADHVAVVSDVRDGDGVPYLIHHEGPLQRSFEEDVLASRADLVGHFRL
ncbi:DUF1287 domain-containing protein [Caniella muris]|uniref:DUF1287 domain-containing protein n=1 Tax=Caniella muris TaxID=2941502 RepID=UPI00203F7B9A|nr:DUF1287 domain-containing protein [Caniella muris]